MIFYKKLQMKKINNWSFSILMLFILLGCNQKENKDDYIRELEEKNRSLEVQIEQNNRKTVEINNKKPSEQTIYNAPKNDLDYFTIGSTEDEVITVMGDPTSILNLEASSTKILSYGNSSVDLKNGKVSSYNNFGNNLRVRYSNKSAKESSNGTKYVYFTGFTDTKNELNICYSTIFTIENYTKEKMIKIKNCLIEVLKSNRMSEVRISLTPNTFETLERASELWENEKGNRIFGDGACYSSRF